MRDHNILVTGLNWLYYYRRYLSLINICSNASIAHVLLARVVVIYSLLHISHNQQSPAYLTNLHLFVWLMGYHGSSLQDQSEHLSIQEATHLDIFYSDANLGKTHMLLAHQVLLQPLLGVAQDEERAAHITHLHVFHGRHGVLLNSLKKNME